MLRRGQTFTLAGTRYKVTAVSPCCATCQALTTTTVTVAAKNGTTRSFVAHSTKIIHISADTPLDLLAEFERTLGT